MLLNQLAKQAAVREYAKVMRLEDVSTGKIRISKLTEEAIEAAIVKYMLENKEISDLLRNS